MSSIILERVEALPFVIGSVVINKRKRNAFQIRREKNLDDLFSSDVASDVIYHRSNGTIVNFRGWLREEYFEADPGTETSVNDNTIILRIPTHRFNYTVGDNDWLEVDGQRFNVVLLKKNMGGTSVFLLQRK